MLKPTDSKFNLRAFAVMAVAIALVAMMGLVGCGEAEPPAATETPTANTLPENGDVTVTMLVSSPAGEQEVSYDSELVLPEGSTVIDAFSITGLNVVVEDSEYGAFVTSINGIENAGTKGWTYTLNGREIQESAGNQILQNGDTIEWTYIDSAE